MVRADVADRDTTPAHAVQHQRLCSADLPKPAPPEFDGDGLQQSMVEPREQRRVRAAVIIAGAKGLSSHGLLVLTD
jgi:hypothetical protein